MGFDHAAQAGDEPRAGAGPLRRGSARSLAASSFLIEDHLDRRVPPPAPWTRPTPLLPLCATCLRPLDPTDPTAVPRPHGDLHAGCWAAIRPRGGAAALPPPAPPPIDPAAWHPLPDYPGYEGNAEGRCRTARGPLKFHSTPGHGRKYTIRHRDGRMKNPTYRQVAAMVTAAALAAEEDA